MKNPISASAVAAEKAFVHNAYEARLKLSPTEQRKQGILLFPLNVTSQQSNGTQTDVQFTTSFSINEQYFRKGSTVKCQQGSWSAEGRLQDVHSFGGQFTLYEDEIPNLRDEPVTLQFIPDDRTLFCMDLGCRLAQENPFLQKFAADLDLPKDFTNRSDLPGLNDAQQTAVAAICGDSPTVLIQGPPGTGKTHTLSAAILQLAKSGKRVIISAPGNAAVDHLCHQLIAAKIPLLRVGNEEKMTALTEQFTLQGHLENGSTRRMLEHLQKSLRKAEDAANKYVRNFTADAAKERQEARKEVRQLRKEIRETFREAKADLLKSIPVIAGTPVGLFNELPKEFLADVVVMDEAGQALEPLAWLTASFGQRLVLCGDPQQLSPLVFSPEARKQGLVVSLLERVMRPDNSILLDKQYRMAVPIVGAVNGYFYGDQLQTAVEHDGQLIFIDMAGFGEGEQQDETSGSTFHRDEAAVVKTIAEHYQLKASETVVLSPYAAQLAELQKTLGKEWRVSTIDSIQGQEADHIVISLTRSNMDGEIGFLSDYRRTNVAITRARKTCILVGDSATLGQDVFYEGLIKHIEDQGGYKSAWEFV